MTTWLLPFFEFCFLIENWQRRLQFGPLSENELQAVVVFAIFPDIEFSLTCALRHRFQLIVKLDRVWMRVSRDKPLSEVRDLF